MSVTELARKIWWVPAKLREPIQGVVLDLLAGRENASERGQVRGDGFNVSWTEHGALFVRWGDGGACEKLMVEGRSSWRSFAELLERTQASRRENHGLRLEVDVTPGVEFEFDDDDLGRMEYALQELYGHMVRVKLRRVPGSGDVGERVRNIRRLLVDSKNHGTLPRETVERINEALDEAREVQSAMREE